MILPGMAVISEVIPVYSRKHIFGYTFIAYSSVAIALLGFFVWGHHMFTSGREQASPDDLLSFADVHGRDPVGHQGLQLAVATLYKGSIHFNTPMLLRPGFIFLFTIGGLTGLFLGALAVDIHLHDTYFVVAHFHYVMMGGTLIAFLAGIHHWWPKMFGVMYNETLGPKIACLIIFVGFNLTFFPQFILGTQGMPRRYASYEGMTGPNGEKITQATQDLYQTLHQWSTVGSMTLGVGLLVAAVVLVASFWSKRRAPANPWGAATLEWKACSPPTHHNFEAMPWVGAPYVYDDFVWDEDLGGYVELLPDLTREAKPAEQPAAT